MEKQELIHRDSLIISFEEFKNIVIDVYLFIFIINFKYFEYEYFKSRR